MVVEERIFTFHPGALKKYLSIYEREGMKIQKRHLKNMIGYFVVETGMLNQAVNLWGYEDHAQRTQQRSSLVADPEWQAYVATIHPLMQSMETKFLLPTSFSPIS